MFSQTIPIDWMATIRAVAKSRHALHANHATSRPLSPDYEVVGLVGEYAFSAAFGIMGDWSRRPGGDNGVDFEIGRLTVDIKTDRKSVV